MIRVYHNPRCSKSREAVRLLEEACAAYEVVEYLKETPSSAFFEAVVQSLGDDALRKGEDAYKLHIKGQNLLPPAIGRIMAQHPILLERPLLEKDGQFLVARPPEKVREFL